MLYCSLIHIWEYNSSCKSGKYGLNLLQYIILHGNMETSYIRLVRRNAHGSQCVDGSAKEIPEKQNKFFKKSYKSPISHQNVALFTHCGSWEGAGVRSAVGKQ